MIRSPAPTTLLAIVLLAAASGCHREPPPAPVSDSPVRSAPESPPPPRPSPPSPDEIHAARCTELQTRFARVLAAATGSCLANSGCSCYRSIVPDAGCGGVTDSNTAELLHGIELDFHEANCTPPVQCAAQTCRAACRGGQCTTGR